MFPFFLSSVWFEGHMAVFNVVFWYLMQCSLVDWYQCFGGIFREDGVGGSFLSKYTSHLQVTVFNIYPVGTSNLTWFLILNAV